MNAALRSASVHFSGSNCKPSITTCPSVPSFDTVIFVNEPLGSENLPRESKPPRSVNLWLILTVLGLPSATRTVTGTFVARLLAGDVIRSISYSPAWGMLGVKVIEAWPLFVLPSWR